MHATTGQVSARSPASAARLPRGSRIDGRTTPARRAKALVAKFVAELGGPSMVGAVQMLKIERAAQLTVAAECLRAAALRGEEVDPLGLVRIENLAGRALRDLQARTKCEPAGPSLADYIAQRYPADGEGAA